VSRRAIAFGSLATVLAADWTIRRVHPPWLLVGVLDEPAHVATGALVLLNLPERSPAWSAGFMAGSVLPDVDHLPLLLSRTLPEVDDPRPVTHGLLALSPLALMGAAGRGRIRDYALGAATGGLAHFARDLSVGTGVTLLRPLTRHSFRLPYWLYGAGLLTLAVRALRGAD
jgi:inner membrane protein